MIVFPSRLLVPSSCATHTSNLLASQYILLLSTLICSWLDLEPNYELTLFSFWEPPVLTTASYPLIFHISLLSSLIKTIVCLFFLFLFSYHLHPDHVSCANMSRPPFCVSLLIPLPLFFHCSYLENINTLSTFASSMPTLPCDRIEN